jgi:hypothetical protein
MYEQRPWFLNGIGNNSDGVDCSSGAAFYPCELGVNLLAFCLQFRFPVVIGGSKC